MSVLATALASSLTTTDADLVVYDQATSTWIRHPGARYTPAPRTSPNRSARTVRQAVGMVGEPTVEGIATVLGAFWPVRRCRMLPGPIQGADVDTWAQTTVNRFAGIG